MVHKLKVYMTSISSNNAVRKKQQTIIDALDVRGIEYDAIDVSAPENEEGKLFMREHAKAKGGQPNALPPQVFYGEEYVGDYDTFADSLENNCVEEFFKQAKPKNMS
ncbi:hypothetical protein EB796_022733 [Bugula neritina]|uniref:Uncharacterized protein n=1 Tax=Bugula neritina TaxID=10212 RepID=A0A7J7IZJ1_BUGNE|nr:hypothetical protein EB796_022733 [Bugula neritina]